MNWTEEQTDAIIKYGTNIIVSAGAGSGKTAVLSERVVEKLKNGINIDSLLILTFTNMAAMEMKERIRKKIIKNNLEDQLYRLDNSYITTFDSYALSIVKKYGYLLNISKDVSIVEDSVISIKKEEILDKIFEDLYEEKNELFLNLINDFCIKDDNEIKKNILEINKKIELIYDIDDYLDNFISNFYNNSFIISKIKEYENLLNKKITKLNNLYVEIEEYVDSDYYNLLTNQLSELLISDDYDKIKANLCSLPRLKKNMDDAKVYKKKMDDILKELEILCDYDNKEEIKNSIYETKKYSKIIIEILKRFNTQINLFKQQVDLYEFIDIEKLAIKILEENEDIRNNVKYSLNEIMIDEYQDTNDLQDLFISLIANKNVYMVGDIKQSIYRFRNANPFIFKTKYDNYSNQIDGIKIDLNKNFRSRNEVLNNINSIFNIIMSDDIGGANYKDTHQMIFGNTSYDLNGNTNQNNNVEIYSYDYPKNFKYSKEEIEIFTIANDIKQKINSNYKIYDKDTNEIRNLKYSDISILIDRSTKFDLYKKIFEYLSIPLTIYKDEVLTDSIDINIIKNIINLIINKKINKDFKYSFISVNRSFLFNLDDNTIFKYFLNNNYNESELIKKIRSIDYNTLTIKELLLKIIDDFNFYDKLIEVGNIESHICTLEYLIDLSDNLTKMGYTVTQFYDYLETLTNSSYKIQYSLNKEYNGVKIMTIHKSKGLEFNICYYGGLYSKFNISDLKDKFIFDPTLGIITPYIYNGIRTTIYKDILKNKFIKEEISEKIRLFYVALTRAKEKMIIITPKFDSSNYDELNKIEYRSFYDILNSISNNLTQYTKEIDLDSLNLTKDYNFIKKTNIREQLNFINKKLDVKPIDIKSSLIDTKHYSKETNKIIVKRELKNMEYGTHLHSILENLDFNNPNFDFINEFEVNKIKKFLSNKIFNGVINIYKEYEFIYEEDGIENHGIIDLLLEYKDSFKIIDYKTKSIDDKNYINQLNGYKNYISSITNKKVEIYLYSIIDGILKKL
ncbi:MAG: UvrD-helicase domain-containing protein [Bacilli bacterium]|nr:UvrD-helicase domain-containing protein [Bacilli bacterium]